MADLNMKYMGLDLKNPVIVGSSGLTDSVDSIEQLARAGAGAVILKSVFEEQILIETDHELNEVGYHPEGADYFDVYVKEHHLEQYIKLIESAKRKVDIPIIASINCMTASSWTEYARKFADAGADGLELNYFVLPSDPKLGDRQVEDTLFKLVKDVLSKVEIPVAVKLSPYFSNFANTLKFLSESGVKGIVMFNRFYNPDIDIEKVNLKPGYPFSSGDDYLPTLRWMAIASEFARCDLAASTGIHDGETAVKMILAGASAVQMVSAVYKKHPPIVQETVKFISDWMDRHNYKTVDDFKGRLKQSNVSNPAFFERVQFLKNFGQV